MYYRNKRRGPERPPAKEFNDTLTHCDFTFLTDKEILFYYKYLTSYGKKKFNVINDEFTSVAILKALNNSHLYDSSKSQKISWITKIYCNTVNAYKKKAKLNTISYDAPVCKDGFENIRL